MKKVVLFVLLASVFAAADVTSYITVDPIVGNDTSWVEQGYFYGDAYNVGMVHCKDHSWPPVMTLIQGGSVTGGTSGVDASVSGTQTQSTTAGTDQDGFISTKYYLNDGPAMCGGLQILTVTLHVHFFKAFTRVARVGLPVNCQTNLGITRCDMNVTPWCSNLLTYQLPDWDPLAANDSPVPLPWGWDSRAKCVKINFGPPICRQVNWGTAIKYLTAQPQVPCTFNEIPPG